MLTGKVQTHLKSRRILGDTYEHALPTNTKLR